MELRSCYFCGRTGEGLDAYPVVPERLAADAAVDPARVVLCPDCRSKLRRVLEIALADARGVEPDAATADADGGGAGGPEVTFDAAGSDDGDGDGDDETADRASDEAAGRVPTPADDEADDAAHVATDPVATENADTDAAADTTENADATGGDEGSTDAPDLGAGAASPYRKALRLLQNREFPMERAALVEVMSSAYDLDATECERIVEFAIERGALVDDDGTLRRA
jgi:hypothetical protein